MTYFGAIGLVYFLLAFGGEPERTVDVCVYSEVAGSETAWASALSQATDDWASADISFNGGCPLAVRRAAASVELEGTLGHALRQGSVHLQIMAGDKRCVIDENFKSDDSMVKVAGRVAEQINSSRKCGVLATKSRRCDSGIVVVWSDEEPLLLSAWTSDPKVVRVKSVSRVRNDRELSIDEALILGVVAGNDVAADDVVRAVLFSGEEISTGSRKPLSMAGFCDSVVYSPALRNIVFMHVNAMSANPHLLSHELGHVLLNEGLSADRSFPCNVMKSPQADCKYRSCCASCPEIDSGQRSRTLKSPVFGRCGVTTHDVNAIWELGHSQALPELRKSGMSRLSIPTAVELAGREICKCYPEVTLDGAAVQCLSDPATALAFYSWRYLSTLYPEKVDTFVERYSAFPGYQEFLRKLPLLTPTQAPTPATPPASDP